MLARLRRPNKVCTRPASSNAFGPWQTYAICTECKGSRVCEAKVDYLEVDVHELLALSCTRQGDVDALLQTPPQSLVNIPGEVGCCQYHHLHHKSNIHTFLASLLAAPGKAIDALLQKPLQSLVNTPGEIACCQSQLYSIFLIRGHFS